MHPIEQFLRNEDTFFGIETEELEDGSLRSACSFSEAVDAHELQITVRPCQMDPDDPSLEEQMDLPKAYLQLDMHLVSVEDRTRALELANAYNRTLPHGSVFLEEEEQLLVFRAIWPFDEALPCTWRLRMLMGTGLALREACTAIMANSEPIDQF